MPEGGLLRPSGTNKAFLVTFYYHVLHHWIMQAYRYCVADYNSWIGRGRAKLQHGLVKGIRQSEFALQHST